MKYIKEYGEYIKSINEGLIMTHGIEKSVSIINNFFAQRNIIVRIEYIKMTLDFKIEFDITKNFDFFDIMSDLMKLNNNLGYFPSLIFFRKKKNFLQKFLSKKDDIIRAMSDDFNDIKINEYDLISICYESKYDREVKNLPNNLFHVFDSRYEEKILKKGLIPSSKNKNSEHPERIYLTLTLRDATDLQRIFETEYNQSSKILKITNLDYNFFKFYEDPRGGFDIDKNNKCIYTYQNINTKNISILTESDINDYILNTIFNFHKKY